MGSIDEIKARLDIVEVIGGYVKLQKAGRNFKANCPFHDERTPSFVVFPESQRWRCFGACNEGGDLFTFVMKREGWDFGEALQRLAERAGVELEPRSPQAAEAEQEHERLRSALNTAATFYHHLLTRTPAGARARAYVEQRGLVHETLERFQIGFAPDAWDTARNYLTGQGYSLDELVQAGILTRNQDTGSVYDRFRDRLLITIRDTQGRVAGFGGRALGGQEPKYLNSPQSPVFDKSSILFALDLARKAIRETRTAVIVEGYMDAIAAHQAGFTNVVAQMGTALTETQLRQLKKYAQRFVLALDPDAAGASATLRDVQVARDTLDREGQAVFDPQGLLRFEGHLQADIRVLALPEGRDPDEVILADPSDWQRRVDEALPVIEYMLGIVTAGRDLDDPKVKAEVARQILPLIGDVANPVERDGYLQKLSRLLRVDERAMREEAIALRRAQSAPTRRVARPETPAAPAGPDVSGPGAPAAPATPAAGPAAGRAPAGAARPAPPGSPTEAVVLSILLREPHLLAAADQMLVSAGLRLLSIEDFEHAEHRAIFQVIRHYDITEEPEWDERVDPALRPTLARLLAIALHGKEQDEDFMREELLGLVVALRDRQLRLQGQQLLFAIAEAAERGDLAWYEQCKTLHRDHSQTVNRLRQLRTKRTRYATGQK